MPTQPIQTLQSKHFVVVLAYILAVALFAAVGIHAKQMHKGISVQMAETKNAEAMPEADTPGAWIVTVRRDGALHFGVEMVTPEGLLGKMRSTPRNRMAKLYIKADARASFGALAQVFEQARAALFDSAVLLTSQTESGATGTIVPPKGLEISIGPHSSVGAVVVKLLRSEHGLPKLKVDNKEMQRSELKATLEKLWEEPSIKTVVLEPDQEIEFGDVVHVIDVCKSMDAEVTVPKPKV